MKSVEKELTDRTLSFRAHRFFEILDTIPGRAFAELNVSQIWNAFHLDDGGDFLNRAKLSESMRRDKLSSVSV